MAYDVVGQENSICQGFPRIEGPTAESKDDLFYEPRTLKNVSDSTSCHRHRPGLAGFSGQGQRETGSIAKYQSKYDMVSVPNWRV